MPSMSTPTPVTVVCRYRVRAGQESEMERLLALHWPALREAGLVTDEIPIIYRGLPSQKPGGEPGAERVYVEIFSWKSEEAPSTAHQLPGVMAVWEPMGAICEEMDFPHFRRLELVPGA